jgi:peptidoglycan hydrolase-like protein with peptidoglycan-binding domain
MRGRLALTLAMLAVVSLPASAQAQGPVLKAGSSGPAVTLWQRMANLLIEAPGGPGAPDLLSLDGAFGPRTEAATRWVEGLSGAPADGVVRAVDRRRWLGGFITCCGAQKPTIAPGSYGPLVGHLQMELDEWLRARGPGALVIDLAYGPRTTAAVRVYQDAHGLIVDCITGPETWAELLGLPR